MVLIIVAFFSSFKQELSAGESLSRAVLCSGLQCLRPSGIKCLRYSLEPLIVSRIFLPFFKSLSALYLN